MQIREQQFERLFRSEYGRMYRAAHILLGDDEEAKDDDDNENETKEEYLPPEDDKRKVNEIKENKQETVQ